MHRPVAQHETDPVQVVHLVRIEVFLMGWRVEEGEVILTLLDGPQENEEAHV